MSTKKNTPAAVHIFERNDECSKFNKQIIDTLHSILPNYPLLKKNRPDIMETITFLTTKADKSNKDDLKKIEQLNYYLIGIRHLKLLLSVETTSNVKRWAGYLVCDPPGHYSLKDK